MAKAKKVEETTTPDILSADEVLNEELQRIEDEKASGFLGEPVKDGKVEDPEEKPKEEPEEKTKEEPEEPKKEEPIDTDKLKDEIAAKVSKETADKITEALNGKKTEATAEQKNKYQAAAEEFFAKNGRNPEWHELVPFMVDDALEKIEAKQAEKQRVIEETKKTAEEQNTARQKAFDMYVDEQLLELTNSGKMPRIVDKDDPKDPGVVAKKALFTSMMEVNQKRVSEGKTPIYSVKEIYYEHYKAPTKQPAGADAPVSAGRGNTPVTGEEEMDYREIHNKGFLDFFRK